MISDKGSFCRILFLVVTLLNLLFLFKKLENCFFAIR